MEYIEYNGHKIEPQVYNYDTPEGWNEFINDTYGAISDETFMAPSDWPTVHISGHVND